MTDLVLSPAPDLLPAQLFAPTPRAAVYAVSQSEGGTRAHSARAYQAGASPAEIRQAILLCLGLGMGFSHTYAAEWDYTSP